MSEEVKTKKNVRGNVPHKEADLIAVASNITKAWAKHPELSLMWISQEQMQQTIASFTISFSVRSNVKGTRAETTQSLRSINAEIDKSLSQLKAYIAELYSKEEVSAHYAKFGISRMKRMYMLPVDHDKRLFALDQLLIGIDEHQLSDRKYGATYWKELRDRFAAAKNTATENDSLSAEHVSNKSEQKAVILQTLNSLILLIKANYPKTWKEELRVWGFQKEKY